MTMNWRTWPETINVECMSCNWRGRRSRGTRQNCPQCNSQEVYRMKIDRPYADYNHTRWTPVERVGVEDD